MVEPVEKGHFEDGSANDCCWDDAYVEFTRKLFGQLEYFGWAEFDFELGVFFLCNRVVVIQDALSLDGFVCFGRDPVE
jgi:hypothetical protein